MEEKKEIRISLESCLLFIASVVIIIMAIFIVILYNEKKAEYNRVNELSKAILEKNTNIENTTIESATNIQTDSNVLDEIYMSKKITLGEYELTKETMASCDYLRAFVNANGKLEIVINNLDNTRRVQTDGTYVIEEIKDEIIDLKLGVVKQIKISDEPDNFFVRDVFVLTKTGDVYAVNFTYGYRHDLINKIESNVISLDNYVAKFSESSFDCVVAKKADGTYFICNDGETDGK